MLALTTAQTIFSIALGLIALLITFFALYVASSTLWGERWNRTLPDAGGGDES